MTKAYKETLLAEARRYMFLYRVTGAMVYYRMSQYFYKRSRRKVTV